MALTTDLQVMVMQAGQVVEPLVLVAEFTEVTLEVLEVKEAPVEIVVVLLVYTDVAVEEVQVL